MKRVLIVEDDALLNRTLAYNLEADGFEATGVHSARAAGEKLAGRVYDLILLDVNLPDGDGFALCERIKSARPDALVIFLTANDQESDQLRGYEAGGVDYVTKPFSVAALQRKIRAMFAMLERGGAKRDVYDDGRLVLDFSEQTASLNGKSLLLTAMEFRMLNLFCQNPRRVLTRARLLERLWDADERYIEAHTLTTAVSRIRAKIEADGDRYIKTIYGMGYQWTGGEKRA